MFGWEAIQVNKWYDLNELVNAVSSAAIPSNIMEFTGIGVLPQNNEILNEENFVPASGTDLSYDGTNKIPPGTS